MKDLSKKYSRLTIKGKDVIRFLVVWGFFPPQLAQFVLNDLLSHLCVVEISS